MNVIFGAGGHAKEVGWLLEDMARQGKADGLADAYVARDGAPNIGESIRGIKVLGESDFFDTHRDKALRVFIAIGSPCIRDEVHKKCMAMLTAVQFPALVHPSVQHDQRPGGLRLGPGVLVFAGTSLSTNVSLGAFVNINLNCSISHDTELGAFCSLSPGVHVSGNVDIGRGCLVGTGATLIQGVRIPDHTTIGAGATVTSTITEAGTYVGTPARRLR